ncbi:MAG: glutamine--fructose-6-phosphate transaminase (isomerizing) [Actinomycetaceae bacterium]|nr:glutamine--fructose-6-phosphate transaminase (isomerizing) [Actinomycetaceae bacterium]
MCGIAGCVHTREGSIGLGAVLQGLGRLEYRGYDSAGVAVCGASGLTVAKRAGKLRRLRDCLEEQPLPEGTAAIGHTRWATHGEPSDANAHPHIGGDGELAIVHNGIIDNADALRAAHLAHGVELRSRTDTEIVAHVLAGVVNEVEPDADEPLPPGVPEDERAAARRLVAAVRRVVGMLEGTFTLLVVDPRCPHVIVATRRSSPLLVGTGEKGTYLASDALAFAESVERWFDVGQDHVVVASGSGLVMTDPAGREVDPVAYDFSWAQTDVDKGDFATFMAKEMAEQPEAVAQTLAERLDANGSLCLDEVRISAHELREIDKIIVIACGTSAYAGQVARYAIEHWCRIPCEVELASEFRYRDPIVTARTLVVAISQSGETMDTIQAIRHASEQGAKVLAIVNTPGSQIARAADAVLLTHAGREIAVASTKAFTAQVAACYLLGLYLAQVRGNKYPDEVADYLAKLEAIPHKMAQLLDRLEPVADLAKRLVERGCRSYLFLGRHVGYPVACEGALKLKEIAYVHAEGFASGELKHGPIALVEDGVPVVIIVPTPRRPHLHDKAVASIAEVKARGAVAIVVGEEGDAAAEAAADHFIAIPAVPTLYAPLLSVLPLQRLALEVASALGLDVDQPRNLAKSVTVE